MKKQTLLLAAGSLLALASCQNETAIQSGYTDAQVDSIVNVRLNEEIILLQNSNDSLINTLALEKADSIVAASKGIKVPATSARRTTTTTTTTKTEEAPKAEEKAPSRGLGSKSDQSKQESGTSRGLGSKSDQSKQESNEAGRSGGRGLGSKADQSK